MKKPKISVIIPARNEEETIERALKSVQNQTFQDFELIISNDGSTDKTQKIVEDFMKKDKRIKILNRKEGHSAAFARNRGAESSKGKILIFLDADCTLDKRFLEKVAEKEGRGDAFAVDCFPIQNSIVNYALSGLTVPIILKKESYTKEDSDAPMFFSMTRKAYDSIKGYDENIFYFEDENIAKRFYKKGMTCVSVRDTAQYFELPSTFKEFMRQCRWIAKGTKSIQDKKYRSRQKWLWILKAVFLIFPILFLLVNKTFFLGTLIFTLGVTYISLIARNRNPIKSLVSLPFLYFKTFYVSINLLRKSN